MLVLKISYNGEIHRIQFDQSPDHACIQQAVQDLWPSSIIHWIKYFDEEGDRCTLVEATFTDFRQTAQEISGGRQLLKVEIDCSLPLQDSDYVEAMPVAVGVYSLDQRKMAEEKAKKEEMRLQQEGEEREEEERRRRKEEDAMREIDEEAKRVLEQNARLKEEQARKLEEERLFNEWEIVENDRNADAIAMQMRSQCRCDRNADAIARSQCRCEHPKKTCAGNTGIAQQSSAKEAAVVVETEEDPTMAEIRAEMSRIKAACEAELERHLDEWLQSNHARPTYEDWIADVHPENVKQRATSGPIIDPRMYLEHSFHRILWNTCTTRFDQLTGAQKHWCRVDPREPMSAAILCESSNPVAQQPN